MDDAARKTLASLLERRWVTLACSDAKGIAVASQVAIAWVHGEAAVLMHLSTLARHTRCLLERPAASLGISEDDDGRDDPQTLARVTLSGSVREVQPDNADFEQLARQYLAQLPMAEPRFQFADFKLIRMDLEGAQFVGGFAQAFRVKPEELATLRAH